MTNSLQNQSKQRTTRAPDVLSLRDGPTATTLILAAGVALCGFSVGFTGRADAASSARSSVPAARVEVDFGQRTGRIRPLHGINGGPLCYRGTVDLTAYHRALAVPAIRLHDTVWVNADAVDISTIFRDFTNDPAVPSSYDFAVTDDYLTAAMNTGAAIVYRLGESIEHTPRKYRVHPPSDPAKWAAVCLGIVQHYTQGWAEGFRYAIPYWEIWNEPDVRPAMWTGTDEQYFELYAAAATALKRQFPQLKVGGPALGSVGSWRAGRFEPSPFFKRFLAWVQERKLPLDFFSWHCYTSDPNEMVQRARAVRSVLDAHGFGRTESHLDEWNYLPGGRWHPIAPQGQGKARRAWFEQIGGAPGAAFTAAGLMALQDAPIDMACYYTGEVQGFGLFDFHAVPKKTYYAFLAFRRLLDTPHRVKVETHRRKALWCWAGVAEQGAVARVLLSHLDAGSATLDLHLRYLPWREATTIEERRVDDQHELDAVGERRLAGHEPSIRLNFRGPGVVLLTLRAAQEHSPAAVGGRVEQ